MSPSSGWPASTSAVRTATNTTMTSTRTAMPARSRTGAGSGDRARRTCPGSGMPGRPVLTGPACRSGGPDARLHVGSGAWSFAHPTGASPGAPHTTAAASSRPRPSRSRPLTGASSPSTLRRARPAAARRLGDGRLGGLRTRVRGASSPTCGRAMPPEPALAPGTAVAIATGAALPVGTAGVLRWRARDALGGRPPRRAPFAERPGHPAGRRGGGARRAARAGRHDA